MFWKPAYRPLTALQRRAVGCTDCMLQPALVHAEGVQHGASGDGCML